MTDVIEITGKWGYLAVNRWYHNFIPVRKLRHEIAYAIPHNSHHDVFRSKSLDFMLGEGTLYDQLNEILTQKVRVLVEEGFKNRPTDSNRNRFVRVRLQFSSNQDAIQFKLTCTGKSIAVDLHD